MSFKAYIREEKNEANKHVPHIELDGNRVTVKAGRDALHASSESHYEGWLKLYGNMNNVLYELGTAQFWPGMCEPVAVFQVVDIKRFSKLVAVSYCNNHGIYENEIQL